jgi:hypothetical protein
LGSTSKGESTDGALGATSRRIYMTRVIVHYGYDTDTKSFFRCEDRSDNSADIHVSIDSDWNPSRSYTVTITDNHTRSISGEIPHTGLMEMRACELAEWAETQIDASG